jgi:hypothetical protein
MKLKRFLPILNIVTLVATLFFNYLANALPLNGQTTGQISDRFQIFFKPAGFAFSIWGIIYLGLFGFIMFQALPSQKTKKLMDKIGLFFVLSCLANMGWLLVWHYERFALSLIFILILLLSLVKIYSNLTIGQTKVKTVEKWLLHVPFSLYLGWVSVATIVNISIYLHWVDYYGLEISDEIWYMIATGIGILISFLLTILKSDLVFNLVFVWAYAAIAVQNSQVPFISYYSRIAWIVVIIPVLISLWKNYRPLKTVP